VANPLENGQLYRLRRVGVLVANGLSNRTVDTTCPILFVSLFSALRRPTPLSNDVMASPYSRFSTHTALGLVLPGTPIPARPASVCTTKQAPLSSPTLGIPPESRSSHLTISTTTTWPSLTSTTHTYFLFTVSCTHASECQHSQIHPKSPAFYFGPLSRAVGVPRNVLFHPSPTHLSCDYFTTSHPSILKYSRGFRAIYIQVTMQFDIICLLGITLRMNAIHRECKDHMSAAGATVMVNVDTE
jgi:hypothetical protein